MNGFGPPNLILASGSPRRSQLLKDAGYEFSIIVPDDAVEESVPENQPPAAYVAAASFAKAKAIAANLKDNIVLAADTIAECRGKILGKPIDRAHAKEILTFLSGTQHQVLTGMTLWNCQTAVHRTHVEATILKMAPLDEDTIENYLDSNAWIGKAGAFGYQDGIEWVEIENGLESNVVGLPIELLPEMLKDF